MRLLAAVAVSVVACLAVWRLTRRVLAERESPTLAERWWRARQQSTQVGVAASVVAAILAGGHALWLLPALWTGLLGAWFAARRPLYGETWSFAAYLGWTLRVTAALAGPPLLILVAPMVAAAAGPAWPAATAGLALLAAVRFAGSRRLLVAVLAARPLAEGEAPELRAAAAAIVARSTAPLPELMVTEVAGGRWANAVAIGHRSAPAVVFSRPLMAALEPPQLAAIHAHEVAHLEHYTPRVLRTRTLVLGLATLAALALVPLGRLAGDLPWWLPLAWLVAGVVALTVAQSRHRERETASDVRAVALCGDAEALASALTALHQLNLFPRRLEQAQDAAQSHPSLARRLQAIRDAGEPAAVVRQSLPLAVAGGRPGQHVLLEPDRITWLEGVRDAADATPDALRRAAATAVARPYEELTELRVDVRRRPELVAVDHEGTRRSVTVGDDAVAPLQTALDQLDSRLAAPRLGPLLAPFARGGTLNRLLALLAAMLGLTIPGRGAVALPLLLAAVWPRAPALAAAAAAAVVGAVLALVRPQAGFAVLRDTVTIDVLVLVVGLILAGTAVARARLLPAERRRHRGSVLALLAVWLGLVWALIAATAWAGGGGRLADYPLHAAVAGSPSTLILPAALLAVLLLVPTRSSRAAAVVVVLLMAVTLGIGSSSFRERFSDDLLVARGGDARVREVALTPDLEVATQHAGAQLRLAPGGAAWAVGTYGGYDPAAGRTRTTWRVVFADGRVLEDVDAPDLRLVDGQRALVVVPAEGGGAGELQLRSLPDDGWRIDLGAVATPELGLDPATGRWWVTGRSVSVEAAPDLVRIDGRIGDDEASRATWSLGDTGFAAQWIPVDDRVAVATVLDTPALWGPSEVFVAMAGAAPHRRVVRVTGSDVTPFGATSLTLTCAAGADAATCAAWDPRRFSLWRFHGASPPRHLASLSGAGLPVDVQAVTRATLVRTVAGTLVVVSDDGDVRRLELPTGGTPYAAALAPPDRLALLRVANGATRLSIYRW